MPQKTTTKKNRIKKTSSKGLHMWLQKVIINVFKMLYKLVGATQSLITDCNKKFNKNDLWH